jgi:hypothetical protein
MAVRVGVHAFFRCSWMFASFTDIRDDHAPSSAPSNLRSVSLPRQRLVVRRRPAGAPLTASRSHVYKSISLINFLLQTTI